MPDKSESQVGRDLLLAAKSAVEQEVEVVIHLNGGVQLKAREILPIQQAAAIASILCWEAEHTVCHVRLSEISRIESDEDWIVLKTST